MSSEEKKKTISRIDFGKKVADAAEVQLQEEGCPRVTYKQMDILQKVANDVLTDLLAEGEEVRILRDIVIKTSYLKPKKAVKPDTREEIDVPGHYTPRASFTDTLRKAVY